MANEPLDLTAPLSRFWPGVVMLVALFVPGCTNPKASTASPRTDSAPSYFTNLVYLETNGTQRHVAVKPLNNPEGSKNTNVVQWGDRIEWTNNNNDLEFCVVFSPSDNPNQHPKWEYQHISAQRVCLQLLPRTVGHITNYFKYTIIAFEDVPVVPAPTSPGAATNSVVTICEDPFIIIR